MLYSKQTNWKVQLKLNLNYVVEGEDSVIVAYTNTVGNPEASMLLMNSVYLNGIRFNTSIPGELTVSSVVVDDAGNYSQTSEERTLWDSGFCPLFRGYPLLGGCIALYNPLWGESESRSRVWTQNTLCLPIFGPKPYVDKLQEVVNQIPRSRIDYY